MSAVMKLIVTHFSPDLDASVSVWLIKRFWPGWKEAKVGFVPAGETWEGKPVDSNPEVVHVDTGLGKFDHHNTDEDNCAADLVLSEINADEALERVVDIVNEIDHFREVYFPNPTADFYDLGLVAQLDGWKILYGGNPEKIVDLSLECLDGIYKQFQNKVQAEKLIREEGIEFKTSWGKGVGVETATDEVIHTAQKQGYVIAVRKDPKRRHVRVKSLPDARFDLSAVAEEFRKADPEATWYLHASKHMILNGSTKNPKMKPTSLSLKEIIEILKKV